MDISSMIINSTSARSLRRSLVYLKKSKMRPFAKLKSGSSGSIGRKGSLKKEWSVTPPALIAAIPVGARTTNFFFVCPQIYFRKVDFPVPAFPVRKTDWRVRVISCKASWNSLLSVSNTNSSGMAWGKESSADEQPRVLVRCVLPNGLEVGFRLLAIVEAVGIDTVLAVAHNHIGFRVG